MTTTTPTPGQTTSAVTLGSLKYATHQPGTQFFCEALVQMGATIVGPCIDAGSEPFSIAFTGSREVVERILEAGTFDVLSRRRGNYDLCLTSYGLACWVQHRRPATQEERQETLRRLCIEWKNRFGLRTHLSTRDLQEELTGAVAQGDYQTVDCVLQLRRLVLSNTALALAAQHDSRSLAELALNYGADINAHNGTPLSNTAAAQHWDMLRFLLEQGADPLVPGRGMSVFNMCTDPKALTIMLEYIRGVPSDLAVSIAEHAILCGCDELRVIVWLAARLRAWPGWSPLNLSKIGRAAAWGDAALISAELERHDSADNAQAALAAAVAHGQHALLCELLPRYARYLGDDSVAQAAARGEIQMLKLLIRHRLPALALHVAIAAGQGEALELLLAAQFDLNADQGRALRLAVACGNPATIKMLLGHGADWRQLRGRFGGPECCNVFAAHAEAHGLSDLTAEMV